MKQEESKAVAIEYLGGKDVMPITGYFGPYPHQHDGFPDYFTEEIFRLISEAGINLMVYSYADYATMPELVEKNLTYGEKYGVGVFVTDNSLVENENPETLTLSVVEKQIAKYKNCKSFCGMYVVDEPTASYYCDADGSRLMKKYEKVANILQKDLDLLCYLNLLPIVNMEENCRKNYECYVDEFCDTLNPKVVMWDMYPFDKSREGKMEIFFYNMDVIRSAAKKRGLPFWAFIQAGSQWNDEWGRFDSVKPYYPNEAQFDWSVNASLAFGAQGIQYFPLVQPYQFTMTKTGEGDFERNGIIGAMGNKNQWYYYAQTINKHIVAIDEVLMNAVNQGVIASGKQAVKDMEFTTCMIETGSYEELQSVAGDALIGCFNYQGKTALYVVNHSFEHAQQITLQFDGVQNLKMIQNAKETQTSGESLTLDMAAGEGVLVVIQ